MGSPASICCPSLHLCKQGILLLHIYVFIAILQSVKYAVFFLMSTVTGSYHQLVLSWYYFLPISSLVTFSVHFVSFGWFLAEKGEMLISCQYVQILNSLYFNFPKALYQMAVWSGEDKSRTCSQQACLSCTSYSASTGNKTLSYTDTVLWILYSSYRDKTINKRT